jgi:hypothetical protein
MFAVVASEVEVEVGAVVQLADGWRSWRRRGCSGWMLGSWRGRDAFLGVDSGGIRSAHNPHQLAAPGMVGLQQAEECCGRRER